MDTYQPDRNARNRARDRQESRRRRQMATPQAAPRPVPPAPHTLPPGSPPPPPSYAAQNMPGAHVPPPPYTQRPSATSKRARAARYAERPGSGNGQMRARDLWWHFSRNLFILPVIAFGIVMLFGGFIILRTLNGRIFPNVYAMGMALDGKSIDEAALALRQAWDRDVRIQLVDNDREWMATPAQIGLRLDSRATAEAARAAGVTGIPFGVTIAPVIDLDFLAAQNFLLDLTETTRIQPFNAGYRWEGEELIGIPGSDGRYLDVALTMEYLEANAASIADAKRLDLMMTPLPPEVTDPQPFIDDVIALTSQQLTVTAYDPLYDQQLGWTTDRETLTSWLEAGEDGLTLREELFMPFIEAKNAEVAAIQPLRYIEQNEAVIGMRDAINAGRSRLDLRVRYRQSQYEVQAGDSGYRIAQRTGIPFYQIMVANPNRDWDVNLSIGEIVNLPSRDTTLPLPPVPNKRIVVDIDTQYMVAYENGQPVFNWLISTGMDSAPTSPGVYQILDHTEIANGSSYTLCSSTGCSQWQMYWFMGIYEVIPGLVNGFHGAVLLPNGAYLGGGNVGRPYTYGCIMSENGNAEQLFQWAEQGTVVEIVGAGFQPQSDLAREMIAAVRGA